MSIFATVYLDDEIEVLRNEVELARRELDQAPSGRLNLNTHNEYALFVVRDVLDGEKVRKGITSDKVLLAQMARKEFLLSKIKIWEKDILLLERISKGFITPNEYEIVHKLLKRYRTINYDVFTRSLCDLNCENLRKEKDWDSIEFETTDYKPEGRRFPIHDGRGTCVRSKSELIIANKLNDYGIKFHYEEVLKLNDGSKAVPDFTIRREDGRLFYWEHFGMMGDVQYRDGYSKKISKYASNGIGEWNNLITTFDSIEGIIDTNEIEYAIKSRLILKIQT